MERTITIQGTGKVSSLPDQLILLLRLVTLDEDYRKSVEKSSEKAERISLLFEELGFLKETIKTRAFFIHTKEKSVLKNDLYETEIIGYEVNQTLEIRFPFEQSRLSAVIQALSASTLTPELTIQFAVEDTRALQQQLIQSVAADALFQAECLAGAADLSLGELIQIKNQPSEITGVSPVDFQMEARSFQQSVPSISPIEIEEKMTATFVWQLK